MINILLVEKQPLILSGLIRFLELERGIRIDVSSFDAKEIQRTIKKKEVNILIIDPFSTDNFGLSELEKVQKKFRQIKLLIVSSEKSKSRIGEILKQQIEGFLTKYCTQEELIRAVRMLYKGQKYYCQEALDLIVETSAHSVKIKSADGKKLTSRELELLTLIAKGYSNESAGVEMNLSFHTIRTHRRKLARKLNIKNPADYLIHALELKLVDLPNRL